MRPWSAGPIRRRGATVAMSACSFRLKDSQGGKERQEQAGESQIAAIRIKNRQLAEIGQRGIDRITEPPGLEGDDPAADCATETEPLIPVLEKELAVE